MLDLDAVEAHFYGGLPDAASRTYGLALVRNVRLLLAEAAALRAEEAMRRRRDLVDEARGAK